VTRAFAHALSLLVTRLEQAQIDSGGTAASPYASRDTALVRSVHAWTSRAMRPWRSPLCPAIPPRWSPGRTLGNGVLLRSLGILFCTLLFAAHARAATCGGDFNAFRSAMAHEAAAAGGARSVLESAFAGLTLDGAVLAFDRRQRSRTAIS
jgi:hypothetical protein